MNHHRAVFVCSLVIYALILGSEAAPKRKNVLFLAADDLRVQLGVDHVAGTHSMSTPNLDSIISKSLFLKKAQVCVQSVYWF